MNWALYGIGLCGILLHIAKRVKGQRLGSLWSYIAEHSLQVAVSWLTFSLVFIGWLYQPELAAQLGFAQSPGPLSALLLAFAADSVLTFGADRSATAGKVEP